MYSSGNKKVVLLAPTAANKFGVLLLTFFVMLVAVSLLQPCISAVCDSARDAFLVLSSLQCVAMFLVPSLLTAYLCSTSCSKYVGLSTHVAPRQFVGVIFLMVLMTPAMNMVVEWNENVSLPDFMSGIEHTFRVWEDNALETTEMILGDSSVFGLVSGILIVGCLTGVAEEMFFRAGLQKAMTTSGVNRHVAIWTGAIIFSAMHFQFFGFVPRMLLGALFGYLYSYSDSIWIAATAHAFNNSVVVVSSWLETRGLTGFRLEQLGVDGPLAWVWAAASAILSALFIVFLWRRFLGKAHTCRTDSNMADS